jgi:hypothetical protein
MSATRPQHAEALIPGGCRQPAGQGPWITQTADMLDQQ